MSKHIDLTGKKFTRWTVIRYLGKSMWLCKCDCGKISKVSTSSLNSGNSKSCGCLHKDIISEIGKKTRKYKLEYYRLRIIFNSMKLRCYNKSSNNYKNYGAKGITICEEWLNNPILFCEWAISNGYKNNLTIDRVNNNGNYEPNNCRWVTYQEQNNNRCNNKILEYKNKKYSLSKWCRILNLNYNTTKSRLNYGWSIERAFNGI